MNKIYSLVWNRSRKQIEVASELARSHGGGAAAAASSTLLRGSALAAALLLALSTAPVPAMAAAPSSTPAVTPDECAVPAEQRVDADVRGDAATCDTPAVAGLTLRAVTPMYADGGGTAAHGSDTAIGDHAVAGTSSTSGQSVAVGAYAQAVGDQSTAMGNNTYALGASGVAIGGDDLDKVANKTYTATINGATVTDTGAHLFTDLTGSTAIASGVYHTTTAGDGSVALGPQATAGAENINANGADPNPTLTSVFDIAIGAQAKARGFSSVAIGTGAVATGDASFALGAAAQATYNDALAFGSGAKALADSSFAMGHLAQSQAVGTVAFGANAVAAAENTIAFGFNAQATATDAMALGANSVADGDKAIAIGPGSHATAAHDGTEVDFSTVGGYSGHIAGAIGAAAGVVSFGQDIQYQADPSAPDGIARDANGDPIITDPGVQRQLQNVAPGRISDTSTDAVNGSQLNVTNQQVSANTEDVQQLQATQTHFYSVNSTDETAGNYANDGATGANALAAGVGASASGQDAITVGHGANANQTRDVAIGTGASAGAIAGAVIDQADNTALGSAQALGGGSVAIGQGALATGSNVNGNNNAMALGSQAEVHDYNGVAIGTSASTGLGAVYATAIGSQATVADDAYNAVAIGSASSAGFSNSVAIGPNTETLAVDTVAIGSNAVATHADDVALGAGSSTAAPSTGPYTINGGTIAATSDTNGVVSVGSVGNERQIQNVAAGTLSATSTDAVNGSQLYAVGDALNNLGDSVASGMGGTSSYDPTTGTVTTGLDVGGTTYNNVNDAIDAVNTTASAGWNLSANGGTAVNIAPGGTVDVAQGSNIVVTQATDGSLTIATSDTPTFTSVTTTGDITVGGTINANGGITVAGGQTVDMGGNQVTNVADGTADDDAATVGQVNDAVAGAKTHYYSVNDGGTQGDNYDNDGATGAYALAAGVGATATGSGATAVGNLARGDGDRSTAVGFAAAAGFSSVAVGNSSYAAGDFGVAVGRDASAGYQSVAMGYNAAANGYTGVALGNSATANNTNDVALGAGSSTAAPSTGPYTINGGTIAATSDTNGVVSVGSAGNERQIQNVAAGTVSADSTDAVNGSQLYAVGNSVNNLGTSVASGMGGTSSYDPTTGTVTTGLDVGGTTYNNVNDAIDAVNTTASAGWNLSANGGTAVNIAPGGTVDVAQGSNVVVTQNATTGDLTIAMSDTPVFTSVTTGSGANTVVMDSSGITVNGGANDPVSLTGDGLDNGGNKITNVAAGTDPTDAVNVSQLGDAVDGVKTHYYSVNDGGTQAGNYDNDGATAENSMAIGPDASATNVNSIAVGNQVLASGPQALAFGNLALASGDFSTALGNDANATNLWATAVGVGSHATGSTAIAVGRTAATGDDAISIGTSTRNYDPTDPNALPIDQQFTVGGAFGARSVAIGNDARAKGDYTIAMGNDGLKGADAEGANSIALGGASLAGSATAAEAVAIGHGAQATGDQSIAIGAGNVVSGANSGAFGDPNSITGNDSYAFGNDNTIANDNTFVVGNDVTATQDNSVVLGNASTDRAATTVSSGTVGGITYGTYAGPGSAANGVVSVGAQGQERQVINVAAGDVSSSSTDAINGSQLYAAQVAIGNVATSVASGMGGGSHVNADGTVTTDLSVGGNAYDNVNDALNAVSTTANAGWNLSANGGTGVNIAPGGTVDVAQGNNIVVTQDATTGDLTIATSDTPVFTSVTTGSGANTVVMDGNGITVNGGTNGPVSLTGDGLDNGGNKLTNVAAGTDPNDAVNVSQLGTAVAGAKTHYYSVNDGGTQGGNYDNDGATGAYSLAAGVDASAAGQYATAVGVGADASGYDAIAVGDNALAAYTASVAMGAYSNAGGEYATAIGTAAYSAGTGATAIGAFAHALGDNSTAVGLSAYAAKSGTALGYYSTADVGATSIGVGANAYVGATAIGYGARAAGYASFAGGQVASASGYAATALGHAANAVGDSAVALGNTSVASGAYGTAVGSFAVAQGYSSAALGDNANALGDGSLALGASSIANNANDVALGAGSVTAAANPTASTTIGGTTYNFAGTNPQSVVSVGSVGNERQITNVAAGQLSATSTDAVNGSQLYATNQAIDAVGTVANAGWNLSANGGAPVNVKPGATVDVAQGTNIVVTQAADGSLTIATSMTPVFTSVTAGNSTLDNGGLTVNDGTHNTSYGADGMRITNGPSVTSTGIDAGNQKITNVAAGTAASDAVNVGQLNDATGGLQSQIDNINQGGSGMFQSSADSTGSPSPTGTNSAAGGANAAASGSDSVAVGNDSTASGDHSTALGTSASATGTGSTALGDGASATGDNSVALGAGSVASGDNTVSVGSAGNERQITNVAAGTAPTDAVNVSQLQQAQAGGVQYDTNPDGTTNYNGVTLNPGGDGPTVIHNVATGVGDNDAVNVGQMNTAIAGAVNTANNYTDQRYNELKGSMTQIGNRANAGIASAIAAASLPQPYAPNQSSLGVGLGSFRGEAGIAVGLSKITESGRFILKANVNSSTRGDVGAGIGAGIVW